MASHFRTPQESVPSSGERGVTIDTSDPNFVILKVRTACGHEAEEAKVERAWYELNPEGMENELRVSLAKRCAPWKDEARCAKCPFVPPLSIIR